MASSCFGTCFSDVLTLADAVALWVQVGECVCRNGNLSFKLSKLKKKFRLDLEKHMETSMPPSTEKKTSSRYISKSNPVMVSIQCQNQIKRRNPSLSFELKKKTFLASLLVAMSLGWLTESSLIPKESSTEISSSIPKTNMVHLKMGAPWNLGDSYWKPSFPGLKFLLGHQDVVISWSQAKTNWWCQHIFTVRVPRFGGVIRCFF